MINLFEYQNKAELKKDFDKLEIFLDEVWNNREKSPFKYQEEDIDKIETQKFLQFIHKSNEIKSNKYIGVIHFNDHRINLLPKIFHDPSDSDIGLHLQELHNIQNHILWWLSYCRKIKFPNYQTSLDSKRNDFFEVIIYLFAKYTKQLLSNSLYQQYEEVQSELNFVKGRITMNKYINDNLSKGRWHKLNCTYDAFVFDNKFNRIIKHVSTLLFQVTNSQDNKRQLREILFILDEVSDEVASAEECANIKFNPMFGEFEVVRDYCLLFLSNSISFNFKNDLKLFALLLPMEYVFEDFIFGFIDKEIPELRAKAQRSDIYLDEERLFKLKPDLYIESDHDQFIADTKYKVIYSDPTDPKHGISQPDIYQMVAYAMRFNVNKVKLLYPNTLKQDYNSKTHLNVIDKLAQDMGIQISAYQIPIIDSSILMNGNDSLDLNEMFAPLKLKLDKSLKQIFDLNV